VKREKWRKSRVCLCDKVAACNLTVAASATFSRDKVATRATKSREKIAGVTLVLAVGGVAAVHCILQPVIGQWAGRLKQ